MTAIDPRFRAPIATNAGTPATFTPLCLDPQTRFSRALPGLERDIDKLRAESARLASEIQSRVVNSDDVSDLTVQSEAIDRELAQALRDLAAARDAARTEAMRLPPPPLFAIRVPTSREREQLNSRLLQMGLTHVGTEQMRASMIEALYEIDWSKEGDAVVTQDGAASYNEERADELAGFLDGLWQREDIQVRAFEEWRAQETERVLDTMAGAPDRPETPMPTRIISVRDEAKARLLADRLLETPRMRNLIAKKMDFARRNAVLIARINLLGVDSPVLSPFGPDPVTQAIDEAAVDQLRVELEKAYGTKLADQAWTELIAHIDGLYRLDEFEVGNSDSPPAKPSDPTGSIEASGDIATSGGSSTASGTTAAPVAESETIIEKSSGSISGGEDWTTSSSPTDAG